MSCFFHKSDHGLTVDHSFKANDSFLVHNVTGINRAVKRSDVADLNAKNALICLCPSLNEVLILL